MGRDMLSYLLHTPGAGYVVSWLYGRHQGQYLQTHALVAYTRSGRTRDHHVTFDGVSDPVTTRQLKVGRWD